MGIWNDSSDGDWQFEPSVTWEEIYAESVSNSITVGNTVVSGGSAQVSGAAEALTVNNVNTAGGVGNLARTEAVTPGNTVASANTAETARTEALTPGHVHVSDSLAPLARTEALTTNYLIATASTAEQARVEAITVTDTLIRAATSEVARTEALTPGHTHVSNSAAFSSGITDFLWVESSQQWTDLPTESWEDGQSNRVELVDTVVETISLGAVAGDNSITLTSTETPDALVPFVRTEALTLVNIITPNAVVDLQAVSDFLWSEPIQDWDFPADETWETGDPNKLELLDFVLLGIDYFNTMVEPVILTEVQTDEALAFVNLPTPVVLVDTLEFDPLIMSFAFTESLVLKATEKPGAVLSFDFVGGIELNYFIDTSVPAWRPQGPHDSIWTPDNASDSGWVQKPGVAASWSQGPAHDTEYIKQSPKTTKWTGVAPSPTIWTPEPSKDDDWSEL